MAVLSDDQLKTIFHDVTVEITGLDTNSGVRNTYPREGQPAWKIDDNIVFVTIQPIVNQYGLLRDKVYIPNSPVSGETLTSRESVQYTLVIAADWVFYGPDAFTLANKTRFEILQPDALSALSTYEIAPITDIDPPRLASELLAGQWWKRYDLRVLFNVLVTEAKTIPYLEGSTILLYTEKGLHETIDIEE